MRAIAKLSTRPGDIALTSVPRPEVGDRELLVRIRAIGVGIHDGYFLPPIVEYPYPIGIEAAGVIEQVGSKVMKFRTGEAIAFVSSMQPKGGTWAEFAVVDENSLIVRMPQGMTFAEAAAVPVAGNTAIRAFHALRLEPKESLFIAGASGAIGSFAIQMAAQRGGVVAGSASRKNHPYMLSLGATKTVDYHDADWVEQIRQWMPGGVDAALAIQPGTPAESMPAVKDGGRLVIVSGDQVKAERGIRAEHIPYQVDISDALTQLMGKIAKQEIALELERVYPFEEGIAALEKTQTRHARGKLVIALP